MKKNGPERSSNFKTYISMFDNTVKALIDDMENVIGTFKFRSPHHFGHK
jgi:hypothetical protein